MTISACVITKDEETNIANYIESLLPYVNEIVLVDTGSIDRTVQIANKYNVKLHHYEWKNDFSAAKNFAISKATGEWILFLDADEYFSSKTVSNLLVLIEQYGNEYEAFLTKIINIDIDNENKYLDAFYTVRIFRNLPQIRYIGKIHEQVKSLAGNDLKIKIISEEDLLIYHTGYSENKLQKKAKRNIRLILKEIQDGYSPEQYYVYLAEAYFALNKYEKAVYYARCDINSGKKNITYASRSYRILIESLKRLARPNQEVMEAIKTAIKVFPDVPDFYAEYGLFFYENNDYDNAYIYFQKALQLINTYHGMEPCIVKNSLGVLKQLLSEVCRENDTKKDEHLMEMVQENDLIKQKNKTFYQNTVNKIATKLQLFVTMLLVKENSDSLKWREILPDELIKIVERYFDVNQKLIDDNFSMYLLLLDSVICLHNDNLLQRYLEISRDFSHYCRLKIIETLAENQVIYDIKSFLTDFSEDELLDKDVCYFVGKSYYVNQYYCEAEIYFKHANELKVNKRDILSYLLWIAERR